MRLLQILCFTALYRADTFSDAAKNLGISQSAFSKLFNSLEQELGVELADRNTHHFSLSTAGECLLPYAMSIQTEYDEMLQEIALIKRREHTLKVAISHISQEYGITEKLLQYEVRSSDCHISCSEYDTETAMQQVINDEADLGIVILPTEKISSGLNVLALRQDEQVVIAPYSFSWDVQNDESSPLSYSSTFVFSDMDRLLKEIHQKAVTESFPGSVVQTMHISRYSLEQVIQQKDALTIATRRELVKSYNDSKVRVLQCLPDPLTLCALTRMTDMPKPQLEKLLIFLTEVYATQL